MKYRESVYDDVIEYYWENYQEMLSVDEIDKMDRADVLRYWLEWNGIIGYTFQILDIMGYYEKE